MHGVARRCDGDLADLGANARPRGDGEPDMVGEHVLMQQVRTLVRRLGPCPSPVLVCGETGTGKELVARALHRAGSCPPGPFEAVNCAAIPAELAESELFGHARGAFTGATRAYSGAFERAHGGTLFLDEIGEMPTRLQGKLLRVLEEGMIRRLGAEHPRRVCVRIISATNRDLERESEQGRFRLDLYHRLAVGIIGLPALRDRREDIPLLARHFVEELSRRDGRRYRLDPAVLSHLQSHAWNGNVRALRNAVERAVAIGEEVLSASHFAIDRSLRAAEPHGGYVRYEGRSFSDIQREIYEKTLQEHGGNRSAAAAALGVAKSTFFDQVRAMKIAV